MNGPFKTDFNTRFAKPARKANQPGVLCPKQSIMFIGPAVFSMKPLSAMINAVRLSGMILDIPAGPHRRGYARARVEIRQLLDGRWRVYCKNELLFLESPPPAVQGPLRTLRRHYRSVKNRKLLDSRKQSKKPPPYFAYNARSRTGGHLGTPKINATGDLTIELKPYHTTTRGVTFSLSS